SLFFLVFFFSSRRRHTRFSRDWSSDVCSSDLAFVVGHDPADGAFDEAADVAVPGEEQAEEAEVLGGGAVPGAAEQAQGVEAAPGLGVGRRDGVGAGGEVLDGGGGADGDRFLDGGAELAGGAAGQAGGGVAGGEGQQQDRAAVAGGGEALPRRREVRGRGPQAPPGVGLLVGVGGAGLQAGGEHGVGGVEVGVQDRKSTRLNSSHVKT